MLEASQLANITKKMRLSGDFQTLCLQKVGLSRLFGFQRPQLQGLKTLVGMIGWLLTRL